MKLSTRIGILFGIMLLLCIIASNSSPDFLNPRNINNIIRQFIPLMMMGVSAFVIMSSGGIDFSIGSLAGLTGVIVAYFNGSFLGIIFALFVGLIFGCINGVIAVKTPVKAFIVTIATMTLIRGIALAISEGNLIPLQVTSNYFPIQVLLAVLILGLSFILLFKGNGIIDRKKMTNSLSEKNNIYILYYLFSSFSAVIVGIFLSFRMNGGLPGIGGGYEIDAITIAIFGGALCGYGAINLISVIISALLMAVMGNLFNITGMSVFTQSIFKSVVLFIGFLPVIIKINISGKPSSNFSEGADDLFIELNNGRNLTVKDGYIWSSDGYRLGSIIGSDVHSRGRKIGRISGNEIYDLDGHLICHVENS